MKSKLSAHLESVVEAICEQGCQQVYHIIQQLQLKDTVEYTRSLSEQERAQVLNELQCIMAVYG